MTAAKRGGDAPSPNVPISISNKQGDIAGKETVGGFDGVKPTHDLVASLLAALPRKAEPRDRPDDRSSACALIRQTEVCRLLNYSKYQVDRLEKIDPTFPRRLDLKTRAVNYARVKFDEWFKVNVTDVDVAPEAQPEPEPTPAPKRRPGRPRRT